jgi:hypothetical protein
MCRTTWTGSPDFILRLWRDLRGDAQKLHQACSGCLPCSLLEEISRSFDHSHLLRDSRGNPPIQGDAIFFRLALRKTQGSSTPLGMTEEELVRIAGWAAGIGCAHRIARIGTRTGMSALHDCRHASCNSSLKEVVPNSGIVPTFLFNSIAFCFPGRFNKKIRRHSRIFYELPPFLSLKVG